mmetsp:Transcript_37431/g.87057  ORF Transcript_37431/g.87057 Transcript_37431/m.87057 type:complete len:325 (+) Transcript_37431:654-1628(+)
MFWANHRRQRCSLFAGSLIRSERWRRSRVCKSRASVLARVRSAGVLAGWAGSTHPCSRFLPPACRSCCTICLNLDNHGLWHWASSWHMRCLRRLSQFGSPACSTVPFFFGQLHFEVRGTFGLSNSRVWMKDLSIGAVPSATCSIVALASTLREEVGGLPSFSKRSSSSSRALARRARVLAWPSSTFANSAACRRLRCSCRRRRCASLDRHLARWQCSCVIPAQIPPCRKSPQTHAHSSPVLGTDVETLWSTGQPRLGSVAVGKSPGSCQNLGHDQRAPGHTQGSRRARRAWRALASDHAPASARPQHEISEAEIVVTGLLCAGR